MSHDPQPPNDAADWYARMDGDAPDFEGFTAWLERDARHRLAYDRIIAVDMQIELHRRALSVAMPANDDLPVARSGHRQWMGAVAAIMLTIGTAALMIPHQTISVATAQGEMRTVNLADASSVTLDGGSAISYRGDYGRAIALNNGTALFSVRHDAAHPFSVEAAGYEIRDLGTEFSVSHTGQHLTVSVASGQVEIAGPGVTVVTLNPGDRIDIANGVAERSAVSLASVDSWRNGRLLYDNAPLRLVVADINRYARRPVQIADTDGDKRFSGVLTIGDGTRLAPTLSGLTGVRILEQPGNSAT